MTKKEKVALSAIRFEKAMITLNSAKLDIRSNDFLSANNRIYYAMFYAVRAVVIFKEFDSKKHNRVIGFFNKEFISTNIISKEYGKIINRIKRVREQSDYDDFYIIEKDDTIKNYENVNRFINVIKELIDMLSNTDEGCDTILEDNREK